MNGVLMVKGDGYGVAMAGVGRFGSIRVITILEVGNCLWPPRSEFDFGPF